MGEGVWVGGWVGVNFKVWVGVNFKVWVGVKVWVSVKVDMKVWMVGVKV